MLARAVAAPRTVVWCWHSGGMTRQVTGSFDLTSWDEDTYDEQDGSTLARVRNTKTFRGGIDGSSSMELLTAVTEQGSAAYVGIERVTAAVDGRSGSFVLQHSAVATGGGGSMQVTVVPDSAAGGLVGLSGEMQIDRHDDGEHTYTFDYELT